MKMNPETTYPLKDLSLWMNKHSFVVWRNPGEKEQKGFKATVSILAEGAFPDKDAFIFSPFNSKSRFPALAFYPNDDSFAKGLSDAETPIPVYLTEDIPDSKAEYCKRIELLTAMMESGPLHKCVLSRRLDLDDPDETMAPELFNQLCNQYPNAFVSLIHIPGAFTWTGATPERLLKIRNQKGYTTSLAATRPYIGLLPDISEWNVKETEEQQLVTDYILDVLKNENVHSVECNGPLSMQAGNLIHIKTDIHFSITPQTEIVSLIKALHPTPAVCGLPKDKAFNIINTIEPHDREYYAGYLGVVGKENLELFVNLRCMRWLGGKPSLFIGGGITAASVPEQEWEETNFKAHTLLDVIEKICNLAGKNPNAH
jgi:isochorismate synthase